MAIRIYTGIPGRGMTYEAIMDFLTAESLQQLTGLKHRYYQRRRLSEMGIPFILRPDGFPVVLEESIRSLVSKQKKQSVHEPNFNAIHASQAKKRK